MRLMYAIYRKPHAPIHLSIHTCKTHVMITLRGTNGLSGRLAYPHGPTRLARAWHGRTAQVTWALSRPEPPLNTGRAWVCVNRPTTGAEPNSGLPGSGLNPGQSGLTRPSWFGGYFAIFSQNPQTARPFIFNCKKLCVCWSSNSRSSTPHFNAQTTTPSNAYNKANR